MKNLLFLFLTAALCLAAPYPKIKSQQVRPGAYIMTWGAGDPGPVTFHKDGRYEYRYTYSSIGFGPFMPGTTTTDFYIGVWKWDSNERILTLIEKLQNGCPVNRTFTFELKTDKLETCDPFTGKTSCILLKLSKE